MSNLIINNGKKIKTPVPCSDSRKLARSLSDNRSWLVEYLTKRK